MVTLEMQHKLILVNGPPRAGKDTAADYLAQDLGWYPFKFSAPIKAAIRAAFELHDDEVAYAESIKSEPTALFYGNSYRDTQISFSEDWAKPFFGPTVFGQLAARHLRNAFKQYPDKVGFVCSDSGFAEEALPVLEVFGKQNTLLVKVSRPGTSFQGDSRSYIELDGVTTVDIVNNGSVEHYQDGIKNLARWWLSHDAVNLRPPGRQQEQ
jgi:hypothetical protein